MKHQNLNKRSAGTSVATSLLSLFLCVVLLLGTTFAWFTDSVTGGSNRILAGNLDLEVYHVNAQVTTAESIADAANLWNKDADGNDILWEPGVVSYETFTVKNAGTLALTYRLLMNQLAATAYNTVVSTDSSNGMSLKDVLYVHAVTGAAASARPATKMAAEDKTIAALLAADAKILSGNLDAGETGDALTVYIYWPTDDGNDCNIQNGKSTSDEKPLWLNLSVTATATQYTKESDSFDNRYDANAGVEAPVEEKKDILPVMLGSGEGAVTKVNLQTTVTTTGLEVTYPVGVITTYTSEKAANVQDYTGAKQGLVYVGNELSAAGNNITLTGTQTAAQFELTLDAVAQTNTTLVKVVRSIGAGLTVDAVYHNGAPMNKADSADAAPETEAYAYDSATGVLTLWVFHASPIDIVLSGSDDAPETEDNPYLTFSSEEAFTLKVGDYCYAAWSESNQLESSTNGTDWADFKGTQVGDDYFNPSVTAVQNTEDGKYYVYLRGTGTLVGTDFAYDYTTLTITDNTAPVDCSGNIMTLLSYADPDSATLTSHAFFHLFDGCTALRSAPTLPATTLADNCYCSMFKGCTSLVKAPDLPATVLESGCYTCMFSGCSALTTAPAISATELADNCYREMFSGCTSLKAAPELHGTEAKEQSFCNMFYGCTSLIAAPDLSKITTLAWNCYGSMFEGCTALAEVSALPATTLAELCYQNMFSGCTALNVMECDSEDAEAFVTIPETVPVNEFYGSAVAGMFSGTPYSGNVEFFETDLSGTPKAGKSYKIGILIPTGE